MALTNVDPKGGSEKEISTGIESGLQQRYAELLEKRIEQLENLLKGKPSNAPKTPSDEAKNDETKSSRYRHVVQQWNQTTGRPEDVELDAVKKKANNKSTQTAFTFRRLMNKDDAIKDARSELIIEGEQLRDILKQEIGSDYPGQSFDGDTVWMNAPFAPLVHNWDKLVEAAKENPDDKAGEQCARQDLRMLLDTVRAAPELEQYFNTRDSNRNASITTYDTVWTLFPPETRIVAKLFLNTEQVFVVKQSPTPLDVQPPRPGLFTIVWCWDWDGRKMVKVHFQLEVDPFLGTKRVDQLPFYPIEYYKDGAFGSEAKLCEELKKRGKRFNRIVRTPPGAAQSFSYDGDVVVERRGIVKSWRDDHDETRAMLSRFGDDMFSPAQREKMRRTVVSVRGNFIVDTQAFFEHASRIPKIGEMESTRIAELNPRSKAHQLRSNHGDRGQNPGTLEMSKTFKGHQEDLSEDDFLLFPPRFLGFSTKEKIWGQFSVDQTLDAPGKHPKAFEEQLQLDQRYKSMIQALVEEHVGRTEKESDDRVLFKDIVEGKGRSLVLLLHGPPGVGKTLTAETIAEASAKPLFVVSVAEIGLYPSDAEKNLEKMFALAGKWEAILLVDEADVFLEARSPKTGELVSVLLRALEYYHGIIILTTNRVTVIDIAVQSRIHLAIRYDDLNGDKKAQIFKLFLDRLPPDSIKNRERIDEYITEYASRSKLNGRQIRNVVSSAASLARKLAKQEGGNGDDRLTDKHLKQVVNLTIDFHDQLETITMQQRGLNEVKSAR